MFTNIYFITMKCVIKQSLFLFSEWAGYVIFSSSVYFKNKPYKEGKIIKVSHIADDICIMPLC